MSRKENERTKLIQEKCVTLLTQMLRDEDNKYCVDCDAKGPRWASWNLGIFLCIRCAGIHRNLGVHISRVKSVNLDSWTPEQVISLQQMGNSRARAVYEAQLPDGFRRPQTDTALESFIRAKYEHKKYLAREWVPPPPPKVDWAKEIDEELERQKRKKKAAQVGSALGLSTALSSSSGSGEKKLSSSAASTNAKSSPLPAPLPKPKPGQSGSSPKTQRTAVVNNLALSDHTSDLLGLASPTKPIAAPSNPHDLNNDSFSGFLSAPAAAANVAVSAANCENNAKTSAESQQNTLAKEEEDFFNQGGSALAALGGKDKSGKLTKDSILALYASGPPNAGVNSSAAANHNHLNAGQMAPNAYGVQPQYVGQQAFPAGMGFMGVAGIGGGMGMPSQPPPSQQQHHHHLQQHQHQFMTPPNSASMYNTPVMTAPNAFTSSGMHGGGTVDTSSSIAGFGAQFPPMQTGAYPSQMMGGGSVGLMSGGGIMATGGQPNLNLNLMQTQQNLVGGGVMVGGMHPQMGGGMAMASPFQTTNAGSVSAANTTNLNQQFGNLNIGNVWQ